MILAAVCGYILNKNGSAPTEVVEKNAPNRIKTKTHKKRYSLKLSPTPQEKEYSLTILENNNKEKDELTELHGEHLLTFKSREEMEAFLRKSAKYGIKVRARINVLNSLKVYFPSKESASDFRSSFPEVDLIGDNPAVQIPEPLLQTQAAGLRASPLDFLGVKDNSGWGKGVTVAVIDTGIMDHNSLKGKITHIDLINDDSEISAAHGTSVASLIAGDSKLIKGISPEVNLLDIRALNNEGQGDVFTIAQAIVTATDSGAQVINLSLGSFSDSAVLKNAVQYAQNSGVVLVAAVGNDGQGQVSFPARYPGVIGVGAVDANENYLGFSNRGEQVDVMAPGMEVFAAGTDNSATLFTGTSASSPIVAATLAYQISQNPDMSTDEIINQLYNGANEAGEPGDDPLYGTGILNIGRMEENSNANTSDAAAAGFFLKELPETDQVELSFSGENRGNSSIGKVELVLSYPGFNQSYSFENVQESQSFFESIVLDKNSPVIKNGQEILLQVKYNDDNNSKNDSKGVRIQFK